MTLDASSFVDLYEVLELEPDAEAKALRARISQLYLEARANLEHQNHRKRFYYRELYEIHLPQARLIFLDPQKRAAYDEQLTQFIARKGPVTVPRKPRDNTKFKLSDLPGIASKAPENFDDFSDFADEDLPLPPPIPVLRMSHEEVGRRRDVKRRELIKHEIIASGYRWATGAAIAVLLAGIAAGLAINARVPGVLTAAKTSSLLPLLLYLLIVGALSVFVARLAMRYARRQTVGYLSRLPYDELLRHCGRG